MNFGFVRSLQNMLWKTLAWLFVILFHFSSEDVDKHDRYRWAARRMWRITLLMSYKRRDESRFKFRRRAAAIGVLFKIIGTKVDFETAKDSQLSRPMAGRQYHFTRRGFLDQTKHKDFEIQETQRVGWLTPMSGLEQYFCWCTLLYKPVYATGWLRRGNLRR